MTNKRLSEFGEYLQRVRRSVGYSSLEDAVLAIEEQSSSEDRPISKSMLSLYERGELGAAKPETLALLAKVYRTPYSELARRWFSERYDISPDLRPHDGFIESVDSEQCTLLGPKGSDSEEIKILNQSALQETQKDLPKGSQVGVAAINFLDDNAFFETVAKNLKHGVTYYYFMSEGEHVRYKSLLTRVIDIYPSLSGRLDGKLTHFIPRPNMDFPVNYVVYVLPDGKLVAYVGILAETQPYYFQEAGLYLTWRLFESFRWALTIAQDSSVRRSLLELELKVGQSEFRAKKKSLAPIC